MVGVCKCLYVCVCFDVTYTNIYTHTHTHTHTPIPTQTYQSPFLLEYIARKQKDRQPITSPLNPSHLLDLKSIHPNVFVRRQVLEYLEEKEKKEREREAKRKTQEEKEMERARKDFLRKLRERG